MCIHLSLVEVFSQLRAAYFFRINRQCVVVHSKFIREMRTEGNQMQIELSVSLLKKLMVSQRNISQFKQ